MNASWDQRYAKHEALYGTEPNPFFAQTIANLHGGSMLLPCDGESRNGVYAALQGWDVHAFDSSEVGVKTAKRWASQAGVALDLTVCDAFDFKPSIKFDAIGLLYAHMPAELRHEFHTRVVDWLKPGGTLILEGFHQDQLQFDSGGPRSKSMLFTPEMLAQDFNGLHLEMNAYSRKTLNEGPFHQGEARVHQLIGVKL
jgi:cyclopropane fatty-acyl-phospholipid synthase-like methyltransferase